MRTQPSATQYQIKKTECRNDKGRDFVVADLHGSYDALMRALDHVQFDYQADRLFSVGDLTDRGPDSLNCLRLITQDWFYPVMGNHEMMLLCYQGLWESPIIDKTSFFDNGGQWFLYLDPDERGEIESLCKHYVQHLPLVRTVEHAAGDFDVVHAQLAMPWGIVADTEEITEAMSDSLVWNRDVLRSQFPQLRQELVNQWSEEKGIWRAMAPILAPNKRLTYVGHTIMPFPFLTKSHFFIDNGGYSKSRQEPNYRMDLYEHRAVARWIESCTAY